MFQSLEKAAKNYAEDKGGTIRIFSRDIENAFIEGAKFGAESERTRILDILRTPCFEDQDELNPSLNRVVWLWFANWLEQALKKEGSKVSETKHK